MSNYHYPRTCEEWWANVHEYKEDLLESIKIGLDDRPQMKRILPGTDELPEIKLCAEFPRTNEPQTMVEKFLLGIMNHDHGCVLSILNDVWSAAPDDRSIHSRPAWDVLCDLLSESGVLYEDEMTTEIPA